MDQILYWNEVALEANRQSFTNKSKSEQGGPTLSSRALGIIHIAMHDAYMYVSNSPTYNTYLTSGLPVLMPNTSPLAAIAGAAYTTLVALYPKQKTFFDLKLNSITHILQGEQRGHKIGCEIGRLILEKRGKDPNNNSDNYVPHFGRGKHKSDPNNEQGFLAPYYGAKSNLFSATERHELQAPPIDNLEYTKAIKQVKIKGIAPELMGTLPNTTQKRTSEETLIGIFWGYDGANEIGTPPRLYNQIVREVAIAKNNTIEENARLFALVNVSMADAGILAWDQKYIHNFWRPVNGIREHDKSMGTSGTASNNIDTNCDPSWLPLGAPKTNLNGEKNFTPDFPAYPSGHATFGAAALHITRLFYGVADKNRKKDNLFKNCNFVSDEYNGVSKDNTGTIRPAHLRNFPDGLWQMIIENAWSRIYLGVHWSFDAFKTNAQNEPIFDTKTGGVDLGLKIAEDIFNAKMKMSIIGPRV